METCTLYLIVEGACQYNPHIAQTVPHRFSQSCLARASYRLWSSSVQYILCAVRPARSVQGRVCPCTTHKILSSRGKGTKHTPRRGHERPPWVCDAPPALLLVLHVTPIGGV